ncbi:unnamed protein product (mitochondrion) [Plasmodiophora brassicae]|uniref:Nucleolar protein Dnt1-like N-terminal domain-containing protein n=1 Tax=Plasmodiophora brassicae TaxID=37360 RepID=A0A0G4IZI3_PLABS|nr:hypothetical protein PBRA_001813 [Plasmodiophora brassicae]SPQ93760.1 unnamed protein product [Plasmodiophora brassicae]
MDGRRRLYVHYGVLRKFVQVVHKGDTVTDLCWTIASKAAVLYGESARGSCVRAIRDRHGFDVDPDDIVSDLFQDGDHVYVHDDCLAVRVADGLPRKRPKCDSQRHGAPDTAGRLAASERASSTHSALARDSAQLDPRDMSPVSAPALHERRAAQSDSPADQLPYMQPLPAAVPVPSFDVPSGNTIANRSVVDDVVTGTGNKQNVMDKDDVGERDVDHHDTSNVDMDNREDDSDDEDDDNDKNDVEEDVASDDEEEQKGIQDRSQDGDEDDSVEIIEVREPVSSPGSPTTPTRPCTSVDSVSDAHIVDGGYARADADAASQTDTSDDDSSTVSSSSALSSSSVEESGDDQSRCDTDHASGLASRSMMSCPNDEGVPVSDIAVDPDNDSSSSSSSSSDSCSSGDDDSDSDVDEDEGVRPPSDNGQGADAGSAPRADREQVGKAGSSTANTSGSDSDSSSSSSSSSSSGHDTGPVESAQAGGSPVEFGEFRALVNKKAQGPRQSTSAAGATLVASLARGTGTHKALVHADYRSSAAPATSPKQQPSSSSSSSSSASSGATDAGGQQQQPGSPAPQPMRQSVNLAFQALAAVAAPDAATGSGQRAARRNRHRPKQRAVPADKTTIASVLNARTAAK